MSKHNRAFTLTELLVVISVIGLLAGIVLVSLGDATDSAKIAKTLSWSSGVNHRLGAYAVGIWNFNGDSPTTVYDSSGCNNNGTINGGALRVDETPNNVLGKALYFDGSNDYVDCGTNLGLSGDFNGTIEAWFKANEFKNQTIIVIGNAVAYQSFSLFLWNDGDVSCEFNGGNSYRSTDTQYIIGRWYHFVATKTSGIVNTNTKLYINGAEISGFGASGTPDFVEDVNYIGQWTNAGYRFNGIIDEIRIYKETLSEQAIREQYLAGLEEHQNLVRK